MARASESDSRRRRAAAVSSISTKLQAMLWVVAAVATVHYTDFVNVCLRDDRVHRCRDACALYAPCRSVLIRLCFVNSGYTSMCRWARLQPQPL
jgi:hypothetical protein